MFLVWLAVGFVAGAVSAVLVPAVRKWATKQATDAKSHLPGA